MLMPSSSQPLTASFVCRVSAISAVAPSLVVPLVAAVVLAAFMGGSVARVSNTRPCQEGGRERQRNNNRSSALPAMRQVALSKPSPEERPSPEELVHSHGGWDRRREEPFQPLPAYLGCAPGSFVP